MNEEILGQIGSRLQKT